MKNYFFIKKMYSDSDSGFETDIIEEDSDNEDSFSIYDFSEDPDYIDQYGLQGDVESKEYKQLPEKYIRKHKYDDDLNWEDISVYQRMSAELIEDVTEFLDWYEISRFKGELSEEFIDYHREDVDWDAIFFYQDLSVNFMINYADRLSENGWYWISRRSYLPSKFKKVFVNKLDWDYIIDMYGTPSASENEDEDEDEDKS